MLAVLLGPGPASAQRDLVRAVTWQGVERRYVLHLPGDGVPDRAPLVVVLAGAGQSLEELRTWLPVEPVAKQSGFVVVYPEAIERRWSYWRGGGVELPGRAGEEVDDVGFISALVRELVAKGIADPLRLYVTGVSRGALMTWTLACERSELFAAAAPLSSPMTAPQVEACRPSRAIPIIAVASTADPVQPYDGLIQRPPLPRLVSIPESMSSLVAPARLHRRDGRTAAASPCR